MFLNGNNLKFSFSITNTDFTGEKSWLLSDHAEKTEFFHSVVSRFKTEERVFSFLCSLDAQQETFFTVAFATSQTKTDIAFFTSQRYSVGMDFNEYARTAFSVRSTLFLRGSAPLTEERKSIRFRRHRAPNLFHAPIGVYGRAAALLL